MASLSPVELTRELVHLDTVNPPGNERRAAELVARLLSEGGFRVDYHELGPERASVVARRGSRAGRQPLCLSGHLDTVPFGAAAWQHPPLAAELEGNRLFGRGSSDMKAGLAAMVVAALRTAARLHASAGLLLVISAGEETGCEGARALLHESALLGRAGALVVGEPTANEPVVGHKGTLWLEARARGVTAHGSMPERGVNAIYKAARAVAALERFDLGGAVDPLMGGATLNVGTIRGGLNINSVPDEARIGIDIRTVTGMDHEALCRRLEETLGPEIELTRLVDAASVSTDPESPFVRRVYEIVEPILGAKPVPRTVTYFTDAAYLRQALAAPPPPTIILGPGEPALAHQTDEYCLVSRIEEAAAIYERLIVDWCEL